MIKNTLLTIPFVLGLVFCNLSLAGSSNIAVMSLLLLNDQNPKLISDKQLDSISDGIGAADITDSKIVSTSSGGAAIHKFTGPDGEAVFCGNLSTVGLSTNLIVQNSSGTTSIIEVSSGNRNLRLSFDLSNLDLLGLTAEELFASGRATIDISSDTDGIIVSIPKDTMDSVQASNPTVEIDGLSASISDLLILQDDPLIMWYYPAVPTVDSTIPGDGETNVDINISEVTITFKTRMDGINDGFDFSHWSYNFPEWAFLTTYWSNNDFTFHIPLSGSLDPGTWYTFTLNPDDPPAWVSGQFLSNMGGVALKQYTFSFKTAEN